MWWIGALALLAIVVAAVLVNWQRVVRRLRRDHVGEAHELIGLFEHAGQQGREIIVRPSDYALREVVIVWLAKFHGLELVGAEPIRKGSWALSEPLLFRPHAGAIA